MTQIPPVKAGDSDDVTNMHGRSAHRGRDNHYLQLVTNPIRIKSHPLECELASQTKPDCQTLCEILDCDQTEKHFRSEIPLAFSKSE